MSFSQYLIEWESNYGEKIKEIDLFDPELTKNWTNMQKINFAKIFYHARGHFHEFLWYVGNHADDKFTKDVVIQNISEELNGSAKSHEQMYFLFAEAVNSDVSNEYVTEENYVEDIKNFNKGHIKWLHEHDADERFCAFAAYEKLDNVDYSYLLKLVESLGVEGKGQIFFKIHAQVQHFEPTIKKLEAIWDDSSKKLINSFEFIGNHQLNMWKTISNRIY